MYYAGIFQQYLVYQVKKIRLQVVISLLFNQKHGISCLLLIYTGIQPYEYLFVGLLHFQPEVEAYNSFTICHDCLWYVLFVCSLQIFIQSQCQFI